jgi:Archaeal/vacuolar-type H+-ATPase subunit A
VGVFIPRGVDADGLALSLAWEFVPTVTVGDALSAGHVIGTVPGSETIEHRVMVPPGKEGVVKTLESGSFFITPTVCQLEDGSEIAMMQEWPVRHPRPFVQKYAPDVPLLTGQRILDFLFPLAKGGTAGIPGPFGSGKTVPQKRLAKWSDAQVVP